VYLSVRLYSALTVEQSWHLSPDTVLTDVGSVKLPVVEAIISCGLIYWRHPMAEQQKVALKFQPTYLRLSSCSDTAANLTPTLRSETVEAPPLELLWASYCRAQMSMTGAASWIFILPVMVKAV